jgi:hypothetical protein
VVHTAALSFALPRRRYGKLSKIARIELRYERVNFIDGNNLNRLDIIF